MATLEIITGDKAGHSYELEGDQLVIGREPFCDVVLNARSISRQHARVFRQGEGFFVEDLGSLNGTYVNGQRIAGRTELHDQDRLRLFETVIAFRELAPTLAELAPDAQRTDDIGTIDSNASPLATILGALDATAEPRVDVGSQAKLQAVLEITRNLGRSLAADDFLPKILDSLFDIFPQSDTGYILMARGPEEQLTPRAIKNRNGEVDASTTMGPVDRRVANRVMSDGEAILSTNKGEESSIFDTGTRSTMSVPLMGPSRKPVGLIYLETRDGDRCFQEDDLEVLLSVATVAGRAVEHARAHEVTLKLDRRQRELATAREVQLHFLPQHRPDVPGYRFFDYYCAADNVGGDYFGYVSLPDGRWAIAMGDVSGKGVSAALLMARLCSAVRYCLATSPDAAQAMVSLNEEFSDPGLDDRFVTFLLCIIDPVAHMLSIANAGHMPPLVRRAASGALEPLGSEEAGPPLGLDPAWPYAAYACQLAAGDTVVMYTDGISEATSPKDQMYGPQRISAVVQSSSGGAELIGRTLLEDVQKFMSDQPQSDDICLLCFERAAE